MSNETYVPFSNQFQLPSQIPVPVPKIPGQTLVQGQTLVPGQIPMSIPMPRPMNISDLGSGGQLPPEIQKQLMQQQQQFQQQQQLQQQMIQQQQFQQQQQQQQQ